MALTKTVTSLISNETIAAGSSIVSTDSINLSEAVDFGIGVKATPNGSATSGVTVELIADPRSIDPNFAVNDYFTPVDAGDVDLYAGHVCQAFFPMNRSAKYVKVRIKNNDATYSVTAVYAYALVQKP